MSGFKESNGALKLILYTFAYTITILLIIGIVAVIINNPSTTSVGTEKIIQIIGIATPCFLVGLIILFIRLKQDFNKISGYKFIVGECTSYDYYPSSDSNDLNHLLIISYIVENKSYKLKTRSNFGPRNVRRKYKIYYNPSDPNSAFIDWGIIYNILIYLVGVLPILGGIAAILL